MTSYSRQDALRILEISARQLQGWERAGLISPQQSYSFQDLGQLRTLRSLREESVSASSIRDSIVAMKAVAGMANPLTEACLVKAGTRLAFRHDGAMVDPIRRQLLFDFDRAGRGKRPPASPGATPFEKQPATTGATRSTQDRFLAAVQAEEAGDKQRAVALYEEILQIHPRHAASMINLGTLCFHQRQFGRAEQLYRRATETDPHYALAFFDLGNVLDEMGRVEESIAAYRRSVELSPRYADAYYNLALAYERRNAGRAALRYWQAYLHLDGHGPWAEHARRQIRSLLSRENLAVVARAKQFIPPCKGKAALELA